MVNFKDSSRRPAATRSAGRSVSAPVALHGLIITYILVLLIPIEFSFYAGTLLITPTRAFLLLTVVPVLFLSITRRSFALEDGLVLFLAAWAFLSSFMRLGAPGVEYGGQRMLEIMVSYFLARTFITSREHIVSLVRLLVPIISILGLLAIPEALSHYRFLHEFPEVLTGFNYYISDDTRYGMLRASSSFEHPILFGLFAASSVSLFWFTAENWFQRFWRTLFTGIASFISLSSAAILVFTLQLGLITLERTTRRLPRRATVFAVVLVSAIAFFELTSNRGTIGLIASYLTFSSYTAYYRIQQWNFTIDDVIRFPFFGVPWGQWTKPFWLTDSIDNHWLHMAFEHGLPASLSLLAIFLILAIKVFRRAKANPTPQSRAIELGWLIAVMALFLGGWTVTYFGKMMSYSTFFLGIGAALARMQPSQGTTATSPQEPPPKHGRYTRFPTARSNKH